MSRGRSRELKPMVLVFPVVRNYTSPRYIPVTMWRLRKMEGRARLALGNTKPWISTANQQKHLNYQDCWANSARNLVSYACGYKAVESHTLPGPKEFPTSQDSSENLPPRQTLQTHQSTLAVWAVKILPGCFPFLFQQIQQSKPCLLRGVFWQCFAKAWSWQKL